MFIVQLHFNDSDAVAYLQRDETTRDQPLFFASFDDASAAATSFIDARVDEYKRTLSHVEVLHVSLRMWSKKPINK